MTQRDIKIGVIGGSGLYHMDHLELIEELDITTPWGKPSDKIRICKHADNSHKIAFLSRHGAGHALNPSEVPYRANIAALKMLGVEMILAFSAVGSLREEIRPLDFVLPSQAIDRTKGVRAATFFEDGCVAHVEFADPFTQELADMILKHGNVLEHGAEIHTQKTLVVMEGPAFSTRAESHMYRQWGCDIINMSTLPEAKLAREAEIAYQVVCMSTDYDCWREIPGEDVSVEAVLKTLARNSDNAKNLLMAVLPDLERGLSNKGRGAIRTGMTQNALITSPKTRSAETMAKLRFLFPNI
jgi:5'-methylthioadenosine phosphorylase